MFVATQQLLCGQASWQLEKAVAGLTDDALSCLQRAPSALSCWTATLLLEHRQLLWLLEAVSVAEHASSGVLRAQEGQEAPFFCKMGSQRLAGGKGWKRGTVTCVVAISHHSPCLSFSFWIFSLRWIII